MLMHDLYKDDKRVKKIEVISYKTNLFYIVTLNDQYAFDSNGRLSKAFRTINEIKEAMNDVTTDFIRHKIKITDDDLNKLYKKWGFN